MKQEDAVEEAAIQYAERYGISNYTIKESLMYYFEEYPTEKERYLVIVDPQTKEEISRKSTKIKSKK